MDRNSVSQKLSKDDEGLTLETAALKPFTVSTQLIILNYLFSPVIFEKVLYFPLHIVLFSLSLIVISF